MRPACLRPLVYEHSKYLLPTYFHFDVILCFILGNEILMRAMLNVHAGRRFPTPALHQSEIKLFNQ